MTHDLALPNRRNHVTQKIKIAGQRTLYLSVHDDQQPAEIFPHLKAVDTFHKYRRIRLTAYSTMRGVMK